MNAVNRAGLGQTKHLAPKQTSVLWIYSTTCSRKHSIAYSNMYTFHAHAHHRCFSELFGFFRCEKLAKRVRNTYKSHQNMDVRINSDKPWTWEFIPKKFYCDILLLLIFFSLQSLLLPWVLFCFSSTDVDVDVDSHFFSSYFLFTIARFNSISFAIFFHFFLGSLFSSPRRSENNNSCRTIVVRCVHTHIVAFVVDLFAFLFYGLDTHFMVLDFLFPYPCPGIRAHTSIGDVM